MRGILASGAYVPYRRLDRSQIGSFVGTGGGKGTRSVASYDEDTTTMGVEAARLARRRAPADPDLLLFATCAPAYVDRTNATAIHAALRLDTDVAAIDFGAAVRSGVGALHLALRGGETTLVVTSDIRTGLPGSGDETAGGDGAAALLVGGDDSGPVVAEFLGGGSATGEFVDRWRTPGDVRSKLWEDRFGEIEYLPLGERAWSTALKAAQLSADRVDRLVVTGLHARAVRSLTGKLGATNAKPVDDLSATVGNTGAAHPGLLLTSALETAEPGQVIALVVLADGADVLLFRTTDGISAFSAGATATVAAQVDAGAPVPYGKFLSWRGMVTLEPPRRPEPPRVSSSAAVRSEEWKFGFVGSRDRETGLVHLPPQRVSVDGSRVDQMEAVPMAAAVGTIATFTIDRMAYSPSPPVVFAVVDFDGGGRLPVEITDLDADEAAIGKRVEMTFRRLYTADGIHDYFWKARLVR